MLNPSLKLSIYGAISREQSVTKHQTVVLAGQTQEQRIPTSIGIWYND